MMAQLHQELEKKEEALTKLQVVVQETKEETQPSIAIAKASTMTKTQMGS